MPPLHFSISDSKSMAYRYVSEVMDGARRLIRILPGNVRETEYRRKAISPCAHGQPRREFPTTWLTDRHTGYWNSIAIPKMEDRISKSAWMAALQPGKLYEMRGMLRQNRPRRIRIRLLCIRLACPYAWRRSNALAVTAPSRRGGALYVGITRQMPGVRTLKRLPHG